MKRMLLYFATCFTLLLGAEGVLLSARGASSPAAGEEGRPEWMKPLPDTVRICRLALPGTHDSGARYGGPDFQTQVSGLDSQLQMGIRAFDIRLQAKDGKLGVFHSHAFQQIYWETDVLPAFIQFLQDHPSEVLVVSLKKEGGRSEDYDALLAASLCRPEHQKYFVEKFRPGLTLGDCRGKILFLHRDLALEPYPGAACRDWADDATCLLKLVGSDGVQGEALLQDEYQYASADEYGQKLDACVRHIQRVNVEPATSDRWAITFVSATGLPQGTPRAFADKLNALFAEYLEQHDVTVRGIVFIDFVGLADGKRLVNDVIDANARK